MSWPIKCGGIIREVTEPKIKALGVAREVAEGHVKVGGVAREFWVSNGKRLEDYAIGESVFLKVNGSPVEFLVVNHGIPGNSASYDASCDGTWLLAKNIYAESVYGSSTKGNVYANSTLHSYLNNTFYNRLDENVRSKVKQVKIPYVAGTGANSYAATGASGLSTKVFLLSPKEVGVSLYYESFGVSGGSGSGTVYYTGDAGSRLSYFVSNSIAASTRWWLRIPEGSSSSDKFENVIASNAEAYYVRTDGKITSATINNSYGVRPALILPGNIRFDETTNEIL